MALKCCERCRAFMTCVTKWFRGERGEEDVCCDVCSFYRDCLSKELYQIKINSFKLENYVNIFLSNILMAPL